MGQCKIKEQNQDLTSSHILRPVLRLVEFTVYFNQIPVFCEKWNFGTKILVSGFRFFLEFPMSFLKSAWNRGSRGLFFLEVKNKMMDLRIPYSRKNGGHLLPRC